MTFNERAEWERREALRVARFEAFVQRRLEAQIRADKAALALCNRRLRERQRQQEFSI